MGSVAQEDDRASARLAAAVAAFVTGVNADEILAKPRGAAEVAFARQVAMYLCHVGFELSLARVAAAFERDRSTVAYACHAVEDRREDARFDTWVAAMEALVGDAPARRAPPRMGAAL